LLKQSLAYLGAIPATQGLSGFSGDAETTEVQSFLGPSMKPIRHVSSAAKPLAALALVLASSTSLALPTINLTTATVNGVAATTSGTISTNQGTVIFAHNETQPAGTGVFNPFLRLDCKGNGCDEQGYNTNAVNSPDPSTGTTRKVLDNMTPVNWTHDVLFSDLQLDSTGQFYQFKLDINEPGNGNSLLSLDGLKLMSTSKAGQYAQATDSSGNLSIAPPYNGTNFEGDVMWDLDAGKDRSVLLDAARLPPGSGVADMVMLVSKDIIDARAKLGDQNFVLWSRFGIEYKANTGNFIDGATAEAGFEEWSYSAKAGTPCNNNCGGGGGGDVPVPGTAALAVLGLGLLGSSRKRGARLARTAA
jgi:hypothetical protein